MTTVVLISTTPSPTTNVVQLVHNDEYQGSACVAKYPYVSLDLKTFYEQQVMVATRNHQEDAEDDSTRIVNAFSKNTVLPRTAMFVCMVEMLTPEPAAP
jgi:hypothetical protein